MSLPLDFPRAQDPQAARLVASLPAVRLTDERLVRAVTMTLGPDDAAVERVMDVMIAAGWRIGVDALYRNEYWPPDDPARPA